MSDIKLQSDPDLTNFDPSKQQNTLPPFNFIIDRLTISSPLLMSTIPRSIPPEIWLTVLDYFDLPELLPLYVALETPPRTNCGRPNSHPQIQTSETFGRSKSERTDTAGPVQLSFHALGQREPGLLPAYYNRPKSSTTTPKNKSSISAASRTTKGNSVSPISSQSVKPLVLALARSLLLKHLLISSVSVSADVDCAGLPYKYMVKNKIQECKWNGSPCEKWSLPDGHYEKKFVGLTGTGKEIREVGNEGGGGNRMGTSLGGERARGEVGEGSGELETDKMEQREMKNQILKTQQMENTLKLKLSKIVFPPGRGFSFGAGLWPTQDFHPCRNGPSPQELVSFSVIFTSPPCFWCADHRPHLERIKLSFSTHNMDPQVSTKDVQLEKHNQGNVNPFSNENAKFVELRKITHEMPLEGVYWQMGLLQPWIWVRLPSEWTDFLSRDIGVEMLFEKDLERRVHWAGLFGQRQWQCCPERLVGFNLRWKILSVLNKDLEETLTGRGKSKSS